MKRDIGKLDDIKLLADCLYAKGHKDHLLKYTFYYKHNCDAIAVALPA